MPNSSVQLFGILLGLASGVCTIVAVLLPEWRRIVLLKYYNSNSEIRQEGMFSVALIMFISKKQAFILVQFYKASVASDRSKNCAKISRSCKVLQRSFAL